MIFVAYFLLSAQNTTAVENCLHPRSGDQLVTGFAPENFSFIPIVR
jgi:hypothetical protein